ncbi:MAG: hypothetical protein E7390_00965 [Ruminococcaceae bacterium]|nr:hypothetical protein [Oscillospiraceae bacterium]
MTKPFRILALLCVLFLLPVWAAEAAESVYVTSEHIACGSFEDGMTGWAGDSSVAAVTDSRAKDGSYSLRLSGQAFDKIGQRIYNLVGGQEYTFTTWVWVESGAKSLYTKFEIVDHTGEYISDPVTTYQTHSVSSHMLWRKIKWEFMAPENADQGYFYIMLTDKSTVYLDGVSMVGPADASQDCVIEEVPAGAENLINSDFEAVDGSGNKLWLASGGWGGPYVSLTEDVEKGKVARIASSVANANPCVRYTLPVEAGCTYQVQCEIKTNGIVGVGPRFEAEYRGGGSGKGEGQSPVFNETFGSWQTVGAKFCVPEGATTMSILIRLYGTGEMLVTNARAHKLHEPARMYYGSSAFNYTDVGYGLCYARANTDAYEIEPGARIRFEILNGGTVLYTHEEAVKEEIVHKFPITDFLEDTYYTLRTSYINAEGKITETDDRTVCRTQRPSRITKEGYFIGYDGEKVLPVMGYHVTGPGDYENCASAGINVVQCNPGGNAAVLQNNLDAAKEAGVYLAVVLYDNGKAAGSAKNAEKTRNLVTKFKDHPALFAWMVQDEPLWNDPYCYPILFDSYELIHSIDKKNPVYMCEASEEMCIDMAGVCDVLGIDPYPSSLGIKRVGDITGNVAKATKGIQPLINILQCYGQTEFTPTAENIRQMAYQGYFMGATGVGYYPVNEPGTAVLWNADYLEEVTDFNKNEAEEAYKVFCSGEYETLAEAYGEDVPVWYKLYKKGNEMYLLVINREDDARTAMVPFASAGFLRAEGQWGEPVLWGNSKLSVTLPGQGAAKYKIFSGVTAFGAAVFRTKDGKEHTGAAGALSEAVQPAVHLLAKEARTVQAIVVEYALYPEGKELVSMAVYPLCIENGSLSANVGGQIEQANWEKEVKIMVFEEAGDMRPYISQTAVRLLRTEGSDA